MFDVREPLSPQAPRDLRARTRGRTGPLPVTCASPHSPPAYEFNCTFRARHPETGGANGSEWERYVQGAGEYGSASGVTFIKGTTIILDPASALYTAIGAGNLRAYVQGADDAGHQGWATRRAERCRRGGRIGSMTSGTRLMAALAIVVLAGCGSTGSLPPPEPPPFSCTPDPQIAPLCGQTTTAPITTWPPTEASTAPPPPPPPPRPPPPAHPPPPPPGGGDPPPPTPPFVPPTPPRGW